MNRFVNAPWKAGARTSPEPPANTPASGLPLPSTGRGNEGDGWSHPRLPNSPSSAKRTLPNAPSSQRFPRTPSAFAPLTLALSPLKGEGTGCARAQASMLRFLGFGHDGLAGERPKTATRHTHRCPPPPAKLLASRVSLAAPALHFRGGGRALAVRPKSSRAQNRCPSTDNSKTAGSGCCAPPDTHPARHRVPAGRDSRVARRPLRGSSALRRNRSQESTAPCRAGGGICRPRIVGREECSTSFSRPTWIFSGARVGDRSVSRTNSSTRRCFLFKRVGEFPPLTLTLSPSSGEGTGSTCPRVTRSAALAPQISPCRDAKARAEFSTNAPASDLPLPSTGRGNEGEGCSHPQLPTSRRTLETVPTRTTTNFKPSRTPSSFELLTLALSPLRGEGTGRAARSLVGARASAPAAAPRLAACAGKPHTLAHANRCGSEGRTPFPPPRFRNAETLILPA